MKDEYDFSRAQRGRFFREGAVLASPIHLDLDLLAILKAKAEAGGVSLDDLVNSLLRKDIESVESARPL